MLYGGLLQESLELVNVIGAFGVRKAFQGMGAICNGCHEFVRRSEAGVGDVFVFVVEVDGVTESLTVGGFDVTAVCTVVFCRGIEVPTIYGVERPGPSGVRFFMNLCVASHGGERHVVIVKRAIEVCVC